MQPGQSSLINLLQADKQEFFCPAIQRAYVWDKGKRRALLDDLQAAYEADTRHFTGTLITAPAADIFRKNGNKDVKVSRVLLVDGQQRLTSLSLLLSVAGRLLSSSDDPEASELCDDIKRCLVLYNAPKLVLTEEDRDAYAAALKGESSSTRDVAKREVVKAVRHFESELRAMDLEQLLAFTRSVLSNTMFVVIALGHDEDPCEFFAAANGRGTPLTAAELSKNLLLMRSGERDLTKAAREYWDPLAHDLPEARVQSLVNDIAYIRHGWMSKPLIYRALEKDMQEMGLASFFKDMMGWKAAFQFVEAKQHSSRTYSSALNHAFRRLDHVRKALPEGIKFIWAVPVRMWQEGRLDEVELVTCLNAVENYVVRMLSAFGTALRDLAEEMPAVLALEHGAAVEAFCRTLYGHESYRQRTDALLSEHLQRLRFGKNNDKNWVMAVLLGIEGRLQPDGLPLQPSLEHITPQKFATASGWSHLDVEAFGNAQYALGNLTVLSVPLNADIARGPYSHKRQVLADSALRINRDLAARYENWDRPQIEERTKELIACVCRLWPHRPL